MITKLLSILIILIGLLPAVSEACADFKPEIRADGNLYVSDNLIYPVEGVLQLTGLTIVKEEAFDSEGRKMIYLSHYSDDRLTFKAEMYSGGLYRLIVTNSSVPFFTSKGVIKVGDRLISLSNKLSLQLPRMAGEVGSFFTVEEYDNISFFTDCEPTYQVAIKNGQKTLTLGEINLFECKIQEILILKRNHEKKNVEKGDATTAVPLI